MTTSLVRDAVTRSLDRGRNRRSEAARHPGPPDGGRGGGRGQPPLRSSEGAFVGVDVFFVDLGDTSSPRCCCAGWIGNRDSAASSRLLPTADRRLAGCSRRDRRDRGDGSVPCRTTPASSKRSTPPGGASRSMVTGTWPSGTDYFGGRRSAFAVPALTPVVVRSRAVLRLWPLVLFGAGHGGQDRLDVVRSSSSAGRPLRSGVVSLVAAAIQSYSDPSTLIFSSFTCGRSRLRCPPRASGSARCFDSYVSVMSWTGPPRLLFVQGGSCSHRVRAAVRGAVRARRRPPKDANAVELLPRVAAASSASTLVEGFIFRRSIVSRSTLDATLGLQPPRRPRVGRQA